ncbi:MAG: trypsin-like peptidase domain-containing protein [Vicinamibacterales bacterium]
MTFLVGLILAGEWTPTRVVSSASPTPGSGRRAAAVAAVPFVSFADVSERINAAVVNIDASANPAGRGPVRSGRPTGEAPPDGPRELDAPRPGSGSGFVIDKAGYILTNQHVIEAAQRITVTLADGRSFRAEVVGADAAIDIALLRIDGAADLPEAPLGNSDQLRVGEWVCAIGNPLGYVHSVTVGVVSFVGRKLYDPSLDNYIQTDAAINFGNSGGPLINTRGEVVGINAAVSPRTSSIGFAVPINQAVAVLPQLKSTGRVARGFLGVTLTDVTPGLQRALGLTVARGAVVQDISVSSPAERAGLRPYDVVVDVEGQAVESNDELIREIAARAPGTAARLAIVRDGRRQTLVVKLSERPRRGEEFGGVAGPPEAGPSRPADAPPRSPLGITVRALDRTFLGRVEVPEPIRGVVIRVVDQAGPAYAVLRRGLVIMEINRRETPTLAAYDTLVAAAKPGDVMAIYFYDPSLGQRSLVTVTVE